MGGFYIPNSLPGEAAIQDKEAEITAKEAEIVNKEAEIAAKRAEIDATVDPDQLTILQAQLDLLVGDLEQLNTELVALQNERAALDYTFWPDNQPTFEEGRYKIRITFDFEDKAGNTRTISREATVWFGNFDHC